MAELNNAVYLDGITKTFLPEDGKFAIVLLDSTDTVIAESAVYLTNPTSATDQKDSYILDEVVWNDATKTIAFNALDYTQTRGLVDNDTLATQFAVYKVSVMTGSPAEAYTNANKTYYWPSKFGDMLFKANLTNPVTVGASNNFKFDSMTISFSEAEAQ